MAWFLAALCVLLAAPVMGSSLETSNSRKLLQVACDPSSSNPNTCYNSDGSQFVCCAGQCSNTPGPTASCPGGSTPPPSTPPPTSGPTNPPPTSGPTNPPPTSGPTNPPPTTAPPNGTPIFDTGSNVNCFTAFPLAPNACYNADGSKYACCTGTCSGTPSATPFCPGGSSIQTPSPTTPPPTSGPTNAPPTGAPTTAPPTSAPTTAPPTSAPTTAPPTIAPTTAPPTNAPTTGPPSASPVFNTGANVNCFTDFPATPNPCYGSDGSKFICCPGVCSSAPSTTPSCPGAPPGVPNPTPTSTPTSTSGGNCVETTGAACGNPPPTGFVGSDNFPPPSRDGRKLITPLPDKPFQTPPSRPSASGGGQSGTGVASPNTPQSSAAGGTVAGKQVTNSYFYLPTPFATSAGGSAATCTGIGTSNSPPVNSVGVSDGQVFFRSLEHTAACGDGAQWTIRIGTGGQIYYLTSTSNGFNGANLIGPAAASFAAYTDRVIQSIAYNTEFSNALCGNPPVPCEWNFHQAGGNGPTYAPLLGNQVSPGGDGVALLSWPRPEFTGIDFGGDKRYRSNLYLQTWIRDVGQGSFELTWIWTNVGTVPVDYIDLPWQGLGFCPDLTHYALSVPTSVIPPDTGCPGGCKYYDHATCPTDQCWNYAYPGEGTGESGLFNCGTQTNGWMAFASANCPLARALGVVFAPKSPAEGGPSNFGCEVRFGRFTDPNRVYGNILETIKRPVGIPPGGGTLEFRYYVTAGATLSAVATQAGRLQGFVKENILTYSAGSVGLILAQTKVPPSVSFQTLAWYALDKVTAGGIPLIIAQHKATGVTVITSSPYVFSCCTPSGPGAQTCALNTCVDPLSNTNYLGFIGWAVGTDVASPSPPAGLTSAVLLSSLLPSAQFFDPQHPDTEIQRDVYVVKP